MSSPATRSKSTSTAIPPPVDNRQASPGGPSARTQTHALAAAIRGTREPRAIHLNGLTRTNVIRRRRTTGAFSSPGPAIQDREPLHLMHLLYYGCLAIDGGVLAGRHRRGSTSCCP